MARAIDLDPGTYQGTYKLIGGSLALDFANLVSYRGTSREHEWLEPSTNIERWLDAAEISTTVVGGTGTIREFREVIARTFLAVADGTRPAAGDVHVIGDLAATTWARCRLRFDQEALAAVWIDPAPSLLDAMATDAASLLTSPDVLRKVSACAGCRWLFLDTSRNHSRRWCDPADCGNRVRQRRHYQRHKRP